MAEDLQGIFAALPAHYRPGLVDREISFYFTLGDRPEDKWTVVIDPKKASVFPGKTRDSCDAVLKTTPEMFVRMVRDGYSPGLFDFTSGRIKTNDIELMRTFKEVFG